MVIILDWYHLTKKLLLRGDVEGALAVLAEVEPRKPDKAEDLRDYLTRHAVEIIDYERRQKAGKSIGSGRMQKAVDRAVGNR